MKPDLLPSSTSGLSPRHSLWHLLLGVLATVGIFSLIPLADYLRVKPVLPEAIETITLNQINYEEPPPPPEEEPLSQLAAIRPVRLSPPQLRVASPTSPLDLSPENLVLELASDTPDMEASLTVNFDIQELSTEVGLFEVKELDLVPQLLSAEGPSYPALAKRRKLQGEVMVEFILEVDGSIGSAQVVSRPEGAGSIFDRECLRVVKGYRFDRVGMRGGKAVRTKFRISFQFAP